MFRKQLLPIILIAAALLAACGSQSAAPTAAAVSGERVSIDGGGVTDAFIAYDETAQQLIAYPADKNATIVLYCRSGRMSAIAAQELVKAGYTNVWNLDGGMVAGEQAGYKLMSK